MTWTTSLPILVFLCICSRLRPDVRDRQADVRRASSLNAPYPRGGCIIIHHDCHAERKAVLNMPRLLQKPYHLFNALFYQLWQRQSPAGAALCRMSIHIVIYLYYKLHRSRIMISQNQSKMVTHDDIRAKFFGLLFILCFAFALL